MGGSYLKTTEYIYTDGKVERGPDLPEKSGGHCMSSIFNGDKTIIIGGRDERFSIKSSTWIFDHSSGTFDVKQPEMNHARYYFGCSTFKSGHHNNRHVVVVAGSYIGDGYGSNTAELFDYETQSATWELSKLFYRCVSALVEDLKAYTSSIFFSIVHLKSIRFNLINCAQKFACAHHSE